MSEAREQWLTERLAERQKATARLCDAVDALRETTLGNGAEVVVSLSALNVVIMAAKDARAS